MAAHLQPRSKVTDADIRRYEGLVFKTATLYEGKVEDIDLDELRQVFRIKVWRALESFDPTRSVMSQDRYVFSCLVNQGKDLLRKKKRGTVYIEDVAPTRQDSEFGGLRDRFEEKYQSVTAEEVYGLIDRQEGFLPNTLSSVEERVVCLLWANYGKGEIASALSLTRKDMADAMDGIRTKMSDWRPTPAVPLHDESLVA